MTAVDTTRAWLPLRATGPGGGLPLFCLPHAGGGASAFRAWLGRVPGAEVLPVQLPGREGRIRDTPHRELLDLAGHLADLVTEVAEGRPFLLYGHSLGALTAFETARELRRRGAPQPVHLVVSGSPAPQKCGSLGRKISTLPEDKLADALRKMGGTPEWLLADPELRAMIFPAVRADFGLRERYRYRAEPPLDLPVTVVASDDDPRAAHRLQLKWQAQTAREFVAHTLRGAHFAVLEQSETTLAHLTDAVRRSVRTTG